MRPSYLRAYRQRVHLLTADGSQGVSGVQVRAGCRWQCLVCALQGAAEHGKRGAQEHGTGSVVLKSTIMPEWWSDRAQAWVHYLPVHVDHGDVLDIMAYLTGDLTTSKANGNDTAGRTVAEAGQNWAATHWRDEDTTAYTFRLYLELARVWSGGDPLGGYVYHAKAEVQV